MKHPLPGHAPLGAAGERGWTILELAATLVIVGILAGIGLVEYRLQVLRARAVATVIEMTVVRVALIRFEADCGALPGPGGRGGDPGLSHAPREFADRWEGPYLDRWPQTTPLGGHLVYAAGGSSAQEPPELSVEGLSRAAADALSSAARKTFGDGVSTKREVGVTTPLKYSVGCVLGDRASPGPRATPLSGGGGS